MAIQSCEQLRAGRCKPCEGGVPKLEREEAVAQLAEVPEWELNDDASMISRKWTFKNFVEGMDFLNKVAEIAEEDQHHPDLHLYGYRNVRIELMTHAIGGLSENDFIVAAKIDAI
ncbi:4a-hydroxytetrahydrobiopterin dehydratase [Calycomorphotria hydatis]|uniref:4a-hydroxytetrahydrobiopterin dehydratase n=1 Tax=Calycomorphotria hydatis TaxID=2528027 RepID=A0A517T6M8_9PLAN|nr:4a-hydroxytetrahydrobiopterin dehydratase [Calycomorphotria hydatis]QDT64020.1 Putative pterin-4-alpha-carbinolamine dehydratase [Calycomorphotria hydatis]